MDNISYGIQYLDSSNEAILTLGFKRGKPAILNVEMVQGNVISLDKIRESFQHFTAVSDADVEPPNEIA